MSKPPTLADHLAARVENKRIVVSRDPDGVLLDAKVESELLDSTGQTEPIDV